MKKEGYFNKINLLKHTFQEPNLNKFLEHDKSIWREVRNKIAEIFDIKNNFKTKILNQNILFDKNVEMVLPVKIGDYTDFYSSKDHATNVGKMFRDPENALLPNWLHIPVGYHGRSSSIVISGTDVKRPSGQILNKESNKPIFSKSKLLDFELEMAFITGKSNKLEKALTLKKQKTIFLDCVYLTIGQQGIFKNGNTFH